MYIASMDLASQGWDKVEETVQDTITRFDGEIVRIREWGERRFTYPIQKQEKGLYVLVHFNAEPSAIENIKGRVELESDLLRVLILRMPEEHAEESFARDSDHQVPDTMDDDFMSDRDDGRMDMKEEPEDNIDAESGEDDEKASEDEDADKEDDDGPEEEEE